jgi:hypothetical protein
MMGRGQTKEGWGGGPINYPPDVPFGSEKKVEPGIRRSCYELQSNLIMINNLTGINSGICNS